MNQEDPKRYEAVDNDLVAGWFVGFALVVLALIVAWLIRACGGVE